MSNEIIVPPLNLPRPPRIDGPQPTCKCCFQSGHLYRDCNHPSLAQLHDLLVRVFVGAQTNPRQNTQRPDHCEVKASQNRLISQIPAYTMRALLWKSKHPSLLLTQHLPNGQPVFPSIRSWRMRENLVGQVPGMRTNQARNLLPNRIGVYSAAARYDLEEMIWINYTAHANDCINQPENIHLAQLRVSILNAQAIAFNLNRFRRTVGGSSSDYAFTPHGLAVYTDSMIQYLTTMRDRQIMMMAPGVNVLNQEETDRLFATYDEPINDRTWSLQHERFAHLDRSQMRNNIERPYHLVSRAGGYVDSIYLHPHFANAAELNARGQEHMVPNINSEIDPLNNYRIEGNVNNVLQNLLPQPPLLPDGIDIDELNEPPVLPPSVQRRAPTFNICIEADDPANFPDLLHNSCSICWDELTPETCCATNCKHTYCFQCMTGALKRERRKTEHSQRYRSVRYMSLNCAMCRQEIQDLKTYSTSDETEAAIITLRSELYTPLVRN